MSLSLQLSGYPEDLPLHELRTAESLVLVSFRLWVLCHIRAPQSRMPDWRAGLRAAGMEMSARQLFDPLLGVIFASGHRPLEVHHTGCLGISRDEGALLSCIALYQHQQVDLADTLLAEWLPPAAVRVASSLAMRFAAALEVARLLLPLRRVMPDGPRQCVVTGVGQGARLLH